jgi:hypothetical protein
MSECIERTTNVQMNYAKQCICFASSILGESFVVLFSRYVCFAYVNVFDIKCAQTCGHFLRLHCIILSYV